ncbi:inositol monophosphatase family protein [Lactococcus kimchii]|uniref:inositol monophosphatase family protein n=1 Tax=Lactococcus sp. S-13 TaxID=2507158 RepID=UPI001CC20581|nr:inositol monophosphatase family protein [Lactococcus sp. S-13]
MKNDLSVLRRLELAKDWVRDAGNFLKENLAEPVEITEKTRYDDLVTNFDHEVQEKLVKNIFHHFPNDKILAEEDEEKIKFSKELPHLWIIDPIDGTTNFIVQKDNFAIMLAYYEFGVGKFGLILDVMKDKLYWCDSHKAFCNQKELEFKPHKLKHSLLGVNSHMYRTNSGGLQDLSSHTLGVRIVGSAGISYTQLLEGKITAYFSNLQPWDYAAGSIIAERIGYITLNLAGEKPQFNCREKVFTAPKTLISEIQKYIKS